MKAKISEASAQEFISSFNPKTAPEPIYALIGADYFYMGKVLQLLIENFVNANSRDFDFVQYFGDEIKNDSYIEQLDMLPFMGDKRVVIIRDIDKIRAEYSQKLPNYLKNPSSEVILILTAEKIDARTTLGKEISQNSMRIICKEPRYKNDIVNWLNAELRRRKVKMNPDAFQFFCDTIQMDYYAAVNEFEKIMIFTNGAEKSITLYDVRSALGIGRTYTIYELQDTLGTRNCVKALSMLENMLQNDEDPIYIIYMLATYYQQLWKVLILMKRNLSPNEIKTRYLNEVNAYFRDKILDAARNYTIPQIRRIFNLLMLADTDLKSVSTKKNMVMDLLFYKICNPNATV